MKEPKLKDFVEFEDKLTKEYGEEFFNNYLRWSAEQEKKRIRERFEVTKFCYLCNRAPKICTCKEPQYAVHENIWKVNGH